MTYYCNDCGMIIREEDVDYEDNNLGEYHGQPAIETYPICPKCGEPVEEYYGNPADAVEYENVVGALLRDAMTESGWRE